MESKRKREVDEDPPRITYHAPNRTFERIFHEETLEETKSVIRKKLGISEDASVELAQLRGGTIIDLEDDDDFEAFRALALSSASVDVRVTLNPSIVSHGGSSTTFVPSQHPTEAGSSFVAPVPTGEDAQHFFDASTEDVVPWKRQVKKSQPRKSKVPVGEPAPSSPLLSIPPAEPLPDEAKQPSKRKKKTKVVSTDVITAPAASVTAGSLPEAPPKESTKQKKTSENTVASVTLVQEILDGEGHDIDISAKRKAMSTKMADEDLQPPAKKRKIETAIAEGTQVLGGEVPPGRKKARTKSAKTQSQESSKAVDKSASSGVTDQSTINLQASGSSTTAETSPSVHVANFLSSRPPLTVEEILASAEHAKQNPVKVKRSRARTKVSHGMSSTRSKEKDSNGPYPSGQGPDHPQTESSANPLAHVPVVPVIQNEVVEPHPQSKRQSKGKIDQGPCPVCKACPFHFQHQCPVVLAGPESIRRRIAELRGQIHQQPVIKDLEKLLQKGTEATHAKESTQNRAASYQQSRSDDERPLASPTLVVPTTESTSNVARKDTLAVTTTPLESPPISPHRSSFPSWTYNIPDSRLQEVPVESRDEGSSSDESDENEEPNDLSQYDDVDMDAFLRGAVKLQDITSLITPDLSEDEQGLAVDEDDISRPPRLPLPKRARILSSESEAEDSEDSIDANLVPASPSLSKSRSASTKPPLVRPSAMTQLRPLDSTSACGDSHQVQSLDPNLVQEDKVASSHQPPAPLIESVSPTPPPAKPQPTLSSQSPPSAGGAPRAPRTPGQRIKNMRDRFGRLSSASSLLRLGQDGSQSILSHPDEESDVSPDLSGIVPDPPRQGSSTAAAVWTTLAPPPSSPSRAVESSPIQLPSEVDELCSEDPNIASRPGSFSLRPSTRPTVKVPQNTKGASTASLFFPASSQIPTQVDQLVQPAVARAQSPTPTSSDEDLDESKTLVAQSATKSSFTFPRLSALKSRLLPSFNSSQTSVNSREKSSQVKRAKSDEDESESDESDASGVVSRVPENRRAGAGIKRRKRGLAKFS